MESILNDLKDLKIIKDTQFSQLDNVANHSLVYLLNGVEGPLILKEIQQSWLNESKLNAQGNFVNNMIQNGVPFSKIFQFEDRNYFLKQHGRLFTLETHIEGIEKDSFTEDVCVSLAKFLGKLHRISEKLNLKFDYDGPWSIEYEQNVFNSSICEKEEFFTQTIDCLSNLNYDKDVLNEATNLFKQKMMELKNDLHSLPKGAVQGDLSLDNTRFNKNQEIIGVFDYNISGDEIYIWEFINQIAWYQEFIKEDINLKPLMIAAYQEERSIINKEKVVLDKWLDFVKYTRFSKFIEIQYYAKQGDIEKVNTYLKQFLSC